MKSSKQDNTKPKTHPRRKVSGIQQKLLCIILPLFLLSFVVTATIIFISSSKTILSNSKRTLQGEADSNLKTVTIDLLISTGSNSISNAYAQIFMMPKVRAELFDTVADIRVMDEGNVFLIDTRTQNILSHSDVTFVGTNLTDYAPGTFYGDISALVASGSTDITSVSDGMGRYYVIVSYMDGAPWALVSYISENYILSDLLQLLYTIVAVFVVVLVIVIIAVSMAIRKMLRPIQSLTQVLTAITDGDFTVSISAKGNDEIALMSRSLEEFVEIMREIILDIRGVSDQLSSASDTTREVAVALNDASCAQAESMGDVKVTIDQVASGVQELSEHAVTLSGFVTATNQRGENARQNMQQTVNVASQGRVDMEGVGVTMSDIVSSMRDLQNIVTQVSESTEQINSMVTLISDIADQTSLLSLNASIEAARAGSAGKGFAVVAEEIRKLAEGSASSASQIAEIIGQVTANVDGMVNQTEQSVSYIEENSKKITAACEVFEHIYQNVSDTSQMLTDIVNQINQVEDVATNIAALSQEQSASAEEILASVEVLANSSLQFSSDSRKVADSAEDVSAASFTLAEHMRRFKI